MHTIKKYANRKLYHTNRKQYITLDGIAGLVQNGDAVQILDNETGDDITSSILAQVVLQARGRSSLQLSTTLLTGMIQLGGDTITNLRRTLFGSLGGTELIETEIGRRIDTLIERGEITPDEGVRWRLLLLRQEFADSAPSHIADQEIDMPSRNDVVQLHAQVDALSSIVEQLLRK
ncbi:pesticidal protein Cry15Aa [Chloroflexales bacterium ZM16-3]|nr:pesticidal protein Cry15Aa [Chloroflexales bacterium ZM16-3]